MRRLQIKFPNQIRISGWDFGSSARAMNQAGGKDSLMTYEIGLEEVDFIQADLRNVRRATFERKQMSTKTSIKRIALVAVAALSFGMLSTVAANAADGDWSSITAASSSVTTASAATATQVAGANNYVSASVYAPAAAFAIQVTGGTASTTTSNVTGSGTSNLLSTQSSAGNVALVIPTPTAGTITVSTYTFTNGAQSSTATSTLTITVTAASVVNVYSSSTVYGYSGDTSTVAAATSTTDAAWSVSASATASTTAQAGMISVLQKDANGTALTSGWKAITVSTTIGALQTTYNTNAGTYVAVTPGSSSAVGFWIVPFGQSGTGTVTVAVNGVTVKTYSVTFFGATASLVPASTFASKTYIGVSSTGTLTWNGKDANGNASETSPADFDYASSSNTDVATVTAADGVATVTGVAPGTATITICNAACTSATIKATATVTITGTTVGSVALSLDKASYTAGELMTLTVTAKDDKGNPLADGSYDLFGTAPVSNVALTGWTAPSDTSITIKGGVKTYTGFYAPLASGKVTIEGTDSLTAANAVSASATVTSATDVVTTQSTANGKAIDALAKVVSDFVAAQTATNASLADSLDSANSAASDANDAATAAVDAANNATDAADAATAAAQDATEAAKAALEAITALQDQTANAADSASSAIDAANAATDAANAAAEAADAATAAAQDAQAAVAALATQVASLIAGIKAQITTLTNLVVKIQKKVKA